MPLVEVENALVCKVLAFPFTAQAHSSAESGLGAVAEAAELVLVSAVRQFDYGVGKVVIFVDAGLSIERCEIDVEAGYCIGSASESIRRNPQGMAGLQGYVSVLKLYINKGDRLDLNPYL